MQITCFMERLLLDREFKMRRRTFIASNLPALGILMPGTLHISVFKSVYAATQPDIPADNPDIQVLGQMARLLYSHPSLSDNTYTEIIHNLLIDLKNKTSKINILKNGVTALNTSMSQDWNDLEEKIQINIMKELEDTPFFKIMQHEVRTRLYRHPAVWEIIGYEGPSLEYGGYINRGFNDIDWLKK